MPAPYSFAEIAETFGSAVNGDAELRVARLMHPLEASKPDDLIFIMDPGLAARLPESPVRCAILADGITPPDGSLDAWFNVGRPRFALAILMDLFERAPHAPPGIHPTAVVEDGAEIGADVSIGALSYIGPNAKIGPGTIVMPQVYVAADAEIGANSLLYPGVRIGEEVRIGDRVIIHYNASLGADGFSFVTPQQASHEAAKSGGDEVTSVLDGIYRIASIGTVRIGDDVEIGAGTAIDRSNIGTTVVGRGTKIDNNCQIGHNVRIGEDCLISGQVGLAGSVKIGNRVVLAGQVGIADHLTIGDDAVVGGGSGLWKNVEPKQIVAGYPAMPKSEAFRREADIARIPRLMRQVAELRKQVSDLLQRQRE